MQAYFAATPFQLLTAMHLKTACFPDDTADLYLIEFNAQLEHYEAIARPFFRSVRRTSQPMQAFAAENGFLTRLAPFLRPRCDLLPCFRDTRYDAVFSTRIGLGNAFYMRFIRQTNPNAAFHYYDEGVSNYGESPFVGGNAARLRALLGSPDPCRRMAGYWLYRPEWLRFALSAPIRAIPPISPESPAIQAFPVSDETRRQLDSMDLLYLDAPIYEHYRVRVDTSRLSQALTRSGRRLTVRLHPSQTATALVGAQPETMRRDELWEACLQHPATENLTLISICSTALVTPKLLFDREPRVILLWKLFAEQWSLSPEVLAFLTSVRQSYRQPERFVIPETWDELTQALRRP